MRIQAPKRSSGSKVEKRRGRPSGSRNSITSKKQVSKPAPPKAKATRKRTFKTQHEGESSRPAKARKEPAGNRKNQPNRDDARDKPDEISAIQPQSQPQPQTQKCEQLATRTRRIAQDRIDTWPQVSPQVLNQIVEMLEDAKKDIVNTQRDHRRELLADETLNVLVGKLARQLSSSKIPPQAKDMHFNIDKLTERNAQLSREVTTERHSKQLLEEQVKVAQHMLESEQENLEQLKKNAKKWQGEWKRQERQGRVSSPLFIKQLKIGWTTNVYSSILC
jgi:hypothetical protein